MKITTVTLLVLLVNFAYAQEMKTWFPLKGRYAVAIRGGASEVIGGKTDNISPMINPAIQYNLSDRLSVVAESFIFLGSQNKHEDNTARDITIERGIHYGLALRYYTHKNLVCGTPVLQSGIYVYKTDENESQVNWIVTPGWIYPLEKGEKLFAEIMGDFQMNSIVKGQPFYITAKVGLMYYF